jgi:uncharacterized LabA/DUF88 family protein
MSEKTYAFIDGQNLYLGIKECGWKLDYKKFFIYLTEKYKVHQAFIYLGYIKKYHNLYNHLANCGFEIIFKKIIHNKHIVKGNVDVLLTVDAIKRSAKYTRCIFVSADGDFLPLYNYLTRDKSKSLTILVPNQKKYSQLLLDYKSRLRFMNDLKDKIGK